MDEKFGEEGHGRYQEVKTNQDSMMSPDLFSDIRSPRFSKFDVRSA